MKHKHLLNRNTPVTLTLLLMVFTLQMGFGQKILLQENFDYTDDTAAQENWTYGTNLSPEITTTETSDTGTNCIKLTNGSSAKDGFIKKTIELVAGIEYTINAKFKKAGSRTGKLRINITNINDNTDTSGDKESLNGANTVWQNHTFNYTPTIGGDYTLLIVEKTNSQLKAIYVDEILITYPGPTVAITSNQTTNESNTSTNPIELTFTTSAATTDFDGVDDFTVENGTLSNFSGSDNTYTADFTATTQGSPSSITVKEDAFTVSGLGNEASSTFTYTYVATLPALTLGTPTSECTDYATSATNETYKVTIPFTNGTNYTNTITATYAGGSVTNSGDDPNTASSGNLIFAGIQEALDLTLSITDSSSNSIGIPSITKPDCGPNTFTGGSNGAGVGYKTAEFWSKGHVPTNTEEAIIQVNTKTEVTDDPNTDIDESKNYKCNLTNNANYEVYKLTVNSEAILNFTKQNELLVGQGGIVNNGTITLTQDAAKSAVLKVTGNASGSGVYEYEVSVQAVTDVNTKKVSLIVPPVTGETIADVQANNSTILKQNDLGTGDQILFGPYNPATDTFSNFTTSSIDDLNNGQGYRAALYQTAGVITFKGGIEVADKTVSGLTAEKFNLIGNPYTTGYSLKGFVEENQNNLDIINTAVTYWNASSGAYTTKSQSELNTTDVYLAPAQAFFVKLATTKTSVAFIKGDSQIYQSSPIAPFRSNNEDLSGIALNIGHNDAIKTTKLYFNAAATLGADRGHEAQAFGKAITDFGIYTQLADSSRTEPLAVQTIPATGLENTTLKLGVNAGLGEHTLSLEGINLPENLNVYLTDLANGSQTLLNKYDYTFNVTENKLEGADRFLISFQSDALSTGNNSLERLQITAFQNTITVNGAIENNTALKVYDLQGRLVAQSALSNNNRQLSLTNSAGVYVVNLSNVQGSKTQKVILK